MRSSESVGVYELRLVNVDSRSSRCHVHVYTYTHTHTHIWREEDSLSNPRFSPRLSRYVRDLFSVPFSHLFLPRYICPSSFDSLPPSPPRIYTHARFNPLCDDEQYSTRKLWHRRRRQVYIRRTDLSDILLNEGRGGRRKILTAIVKRERERSYYRVEENFCEDFKIPRLRCKNCIYQGVGNGKFWTRANFAWKGGCLLNA